MLSRLQALIQFNAIFLIIW